MAAKKFGLPSVRTGWRWLVCLNPTLPNKSLPLKYTPGVSKTAILGNASQCVEVQRVVKIGYYPTLLALLAVQYRDIVHDIDHLRERRWQSLAKLDGRLVRIVVGALPDAACGTQHVVGEDGGTEGFAGNVEVTAERLFGNHGRQRLGSLGGHGMREL